MMKYKHDVVFLLLIFLGCICWCFSLSNGEYLADNYGAVSFRFENEPLHTEKLNEIVEWQKKDDENNVELTAWTQKDSQEIKSNNVIIESDLIYIWGKAKDEFKLQADSSCAISYDKAYELWKSSDVLGKTVVINDVSYKISAVLNDATGVVIVKADKYNDDTTFHVLEIKTSHKTSNWSTNEFKAENSLNPDVIVNYDNFSEASYKVALFPGWIVFFIMSVKIVSKLYLERKNKFMFACLIMALILWIALGLELNQFSFDFPQSLIPTRWSDFEFWGKTFDNIRMQIRTLNLMKIYYADEYFRKTLFSIIIYCVAGSAAFIVGLKYIKMQGINKLIVLEILVSIILFAATLAAMSTGNCSNYMLGYWTMIPLYMAFEYFIEHFHLAERKYKLWQQ